MQIASLLEWMTTVTPGGRLLNDLNIAKNEFDRPTVELIMLVAAVCPFHQLNCVNVAYKT